MKMSNLVGIHNSPADVANILANIENHEPSAKRYTKTRPALVIHDDVIKWKHFSRYWLFVRGINRSTVNSPHKGQWRGALMFSLIYAWKDGWGNNQDARRHCTHYDVTVMQEENNVSPHDWVAWQHQIGVCCITNANWDGRIISKTRSPRQNTEWTEHRKE